MHIKHASPFPNPQTIRSMVSRTSVLDRSGHRELSSSVSPIDLVARRLSHHGPGACFSGKRDRRHSLQCSGLSPIVAGGTSSNETGTAEGSGVNRRKTGCPRIFSVQRELRSAKLGGMSDQFEGSCLCGAVRFVATGQPESVVWCHCESCRKHSGAPVSVFVAFNRNAYVVTEGQITKFNSSPGRWRGFCARCGSTLTCEGERSNETHFHIGAFRDAAQLQPTRHIFPDERLPWLHLGDA